MTVTDSTPSTPSTPSIASTPSVDEGVVEAFAMKVATDQAAGSNSMLVHLGDRLGIWGALASLGSTTSERLAERTGLAERYLREWLSAQAAAGYLVYEPAGRTFTLPAEHAAVLADDSSPAALIGGFDLTAAIWAGVDRLAHAFATGEGIGWHEQDPRLFTACERFFRPLYAGSLVGTWLPAVDGLVERLQQGMRVLDVGCGLGTPTLMMAEAFPASTFVGVDYHDESVRRASYAAELAGRDNVSFEQAGATDFGGTYDLVCYFDALHDLGDPVGALRHARSHLAQGGLVLAVEPGAADGLEGNLHPLGVSWYAGSTALCVAGSLSQEGTAALGAQAGAARLLQVLDEAGFSLARQVVQTPFNLVLEARG